MEITPDQLRYLREQRGLTREELATDLKCSASAIVHWEGGKREIPEWVADKMFSKLPVEFTVAELAELFEICREEQCTFSELLQSAVRFRIEERRLKNNPFEVKEIIGPDTQSKASLIAKPEPGAVEKTACAALVTSSKTSPTSLPISPKPANIVRLPPPPMRGTIAPELPSKVAEDPPKKRKGGSTD